MNKFGVRDNARKSADGPVTSERHTCSAESSTLSTMLPNIGRIVRRTQVDWGMVDHTGAPTFTNKPETFFPLVESAPVRFAHHHNRIYKLPHYM
ncbi:unnamed protein product [Timema podura]|uniref:Uncharacterized protein n=1 Tax=Timema podura TaxID=61482 RepID=A0ABN7PRQ6_TIMPD|nr:unnamed protein product [Timema podura]